jgi:hypothetical protein
MSFPCEVNIRLTSGGILALNGRGLGSCGRPPAEQRDVVERKCQLVGLAPAMVTGR